jgi:hypothetical protein
MKETDKRFYAFISYNHGDRWSALFVKRILEFFFIPAYIRKGEKYQDYLINNNLSLRPIFRDEDNMPGGQELTEGEIHPNLKDSVFLVVLCSPNAVKSKFVGAKEVAYFVDPKNNCQKYIIPLIIKGDHVNLEAPKADSDIEYCYPEELRQFLETKKNNNQEILTIAVKDQKIGFWSIFPYIRYWIRLYKSTIRVAARILREPDFDKLWKKNLRFLRLLLCGIIALFLLLGSFFVPTDMNVSLKDESHKLPAITNGTIIVNDNKEIEYHINKADTTLHIGGLPGYCRYKSIFSSVPVKFRAEKYYEEIDYQASVYSNGNIIQLKRDSTFAIYDGFIIDGNRNPISDVNVTIENQETKSDSNGYFRIVFPIEKQTEAKLIKLSKVNLTPIEETIEPTANKENKAQFLMSNK